jgi:LPS export ABC transporter protein LptC
MNINVLFTSILTGLLAIFFLFKPLELKQKTFTDVPLFELNQFTLYELNKIGLNTLMSGDNAIRYTNRYEVSKINYTDNSQEYIANMKANEGKYKDNIVTLNGNIVYIREDGLIFKTEHATYNKKTHIALCKEQFIGFRGDNTITGRSLKYNNHLDKVESKKVNITYKIGDKI